MTEDVKKIRACPTCGGGFAPEQVVAPAESAAAGEPAGDALRDARPTNDERADVPSDEQMAEARRLGAKRLLLQHDWAVCTHRELVEMLHAWHDSFYREEDRANALNAELEAARSRTVSLEAQLATAQTIQHAEKDILLKEIEAHAETKARNGKLVEALTQIHECGSIGEAERIAAKALEG